MRFQVPQFINIEDKIFGPFTAKQFVYLAGGAGLCYIIFKFLPTFLAIIIIVPIIGISASLAFIKINNKPFIFIVEAAIKYFLGSKLYLWKKEERRPEIKKSAPSEIKTSDFAEKFSENKLKELTWSLYVKKDTTG